MGRRSLYTDQIEESNGFKYIRLKSDRLYWLSDAMSAAQRSHSALSTAISRAFKLLNADREIADSDLERIEWFVDNLESYVGAIRQEIERRRDMQKTRRKIDALRNTTGRNSVEIVEFSRKADALEKKLNEGDKA